MKTDITKNVGHEIGYAILVTIILVVLSVLVFPLFLALLPAAILVGALAIWHLDHIEKKGNKDI
jgi:hypothetical protein